MTRPLLITAGATRNFLDSMRCITANASGKTGAILAAHFPIQCTLLGSPSAILHLAIETKTAPEEHPTIQTQEFTSTMDLYNKMKDWVEDNPKGIIVHSAAVGDYAPQERSGTKIASNQEILSIDLFPTIKILDHVKKWSHQCLLISFKAAAPTTTPQELTEIAQRQRERSLSDLVFANILTKTSTDVQIVTAEKTIQYPSRKDGLLALMNWIRNNREENPVS